MRHFRPLTTLALICISASTAFAQERSPIYPFDVEVGGQAALAPGGPAVIFAEVPKPVAADARVEVATEGEQIIVNVFPIDEAGNPIQGAPAKVIMVNNGTGFDLDATMDQSTLAPGSYGMNIVLASQGTSRVRFVVGTPEQLAAAAAAPAAGPGTAPAPAVGPGMPTATPPSATPIAVPRLNLAGADRFGPVPRATMTNPGASSAAAPAPTSAPTASADGAADQSTPEGTLRLFFTLVREGKLQDLKALAAADCDGDVRDICGVADAPADAQAEVKSYFANGKVAGEARIDGNLAEVDFLFGPNGDREETMELERTGSLWFLKQF